MKTRLIMLAVMFTVLVACGGEEATPTKAVPLFEEATPDVQATVDAAVQETLASAVTDTPAPTNTPASTDTPAPTDTPKPTDTPEPTDTAAPTRTLATTDTPEPISTQKPTDTPEVPIILDPITGMGRTATDPITIPWPMAITAIVHNGSSNFIVKVYSADDEEVLVNTIGSYSGMRPIFATGDVFFDIDADEFWAISLLRPWLTDTAEFSGDGDDVSGWFDAPATGPWELFHDGESNFVVKLFCADGIDVVVNEIGPVNSSGIVQFGEGPCMWEVEADGNWSLSQRK
jgi:hypothetical protein